MSIESYMTPFSIKILRCCQLRNVENWVFFWVKLVYCSTNDLRPCSHSANYISSWGCKCTADHGIWS